MKIGLCTPYKVDNYGTKLQAYAVQEKIKSMGYEVEIVNFDRRSDLRFSKLLKRYANKEYITGKLRKNSSPQIQTSDMRTNLKIRKDAINCFDSSHYMLSPLIKGYSSLCRYAENCSAIICGSDQIWLPNSINNPTTTLEFAPKSCKRIAFAPSFGINNVPQNRRNEYKKFLEQFDSLSVREVRGAEIIKELTGIDAPVVLDPTLTVDIKKWDELANDGRNYISERYLFCYFLGDSVEHRIEARRIADTLGLKMVIMPHFKGFVPADDEYSDIQLYNVTPCDFIRMIREAEYICTDSFHATVFSILYHKRFMTFERYSSSSVKSANSRIYSLLGQLDLLEHIWTDKVECKGEELFPDYISVDNKLKKLQDETDVYLITALNDTPKAQKKPFSFHQKCADDCCGCGACASICPKNCIVMEQEFGTGFRYPKLVNIDSCVHCGQCNIVCPNENHHNVTHSVGEAYYAVNTDPKILNLSSSGGIFYALAKKMIDKKGYVCAAAYNDEFVVHHEIVQTEEELIHLIGSKYSESDLGNCFMQIQMLLQNGNKVLFCGTPCQAHGLRAFLKKDYNNLLVVDLLCYGIQAPEAWKQYKAYMTQADRKIINVNMRDKSESWQNYSMQIIYNDGSVYIADKQTDLYSSSYSKGLFIRPSCYHCQLKAFPRESDITLGDFWDIDKIMPNRNDGKGSSLVFPQTTKGQKLMENLAKEGKIEYRKIDSAKLRLVHPLFCLNAKKNRHSGKFMAMLKAGTYSFDDIVKACRTGFVEQKLRETYRMLRHSR